MTEKKSDKYSIPKEESFQTGSNKAVLENKLGITSMETMEVKESILLQQAYEKMINIYDADHMFSAKDICNLHKLWLSSVYVWAGDYRTVNMSKGGFVFAAAHLLPKLMQDFEQNYLKKYTPTHAIDKAQLATKLSIVHVEYILIHPFREGNGRLGRMLATLMSLQAGFPVLDFSDITDDNRLYYFKAIQEGMAHNYEPMTNIFNQVIKTSIEKY